MLKVKTLSVGPLQANCHILYCDETKEAVIIDPGDEGERIIQTVEELELKPEIILITHGHGDHIAAIEPVKNRFQKPVMIHKDEAHMLTDPEANLSVFIGLNVIAPAADETFVEHDEIDFSGKKIKVIETGGHSPMGCSFLIEDILIAGDALFKRSIGRTDFPGGSYERLLDNIKTKLLVLPGETRVYPGHGPMTTIQDERLNNPFLV